MRYQERCIAAPGFGRAILAGLMSVAAPFGLQAQWRAPLTDIDSLMMVADASQLGGIVDDDAVRTTVE